MKSKLKYIILLLLTVIIFYGCSSSNEEPNFIGNWEKVQPITFMGGYYYSLTLQNDSFFYSVKGYTDVIGSDTCVDLDASWREYASGIFYTVNNKIYFEGYWTDSTYGNKKEKGCFNTGRYDISYFYKWADKDTIILNRNEARFGNFIRYDDPYDKLTFVRK